MKEFKICIIALAVFCLVIVSCSFAMGEEHCRAKDNNIWTVYSDIDDYHIGDLLNY